MGILLSLPDGVTSLTVPGIQGVLPATSPEALEKLAVVQDVLLRAEQIELRTEHVLHGGMYVRTIRLAPEVIISGALIKIPTVVIVNGPTLVLVGDEWQELDGYNVLPACAGRKQLFVSRGTVEITMVFPTRAKTVEEAEVEFTDEHNLLMSRRMDNVVVTTGE